MIKELYVILESIYDKLLWERHSGLIVPDMVTRKKKWQLFPVRASDIFLVCCLQTFFLFLFFSFIFVAKFLIVTFFQFFVTFQCCLLFSLFCLRHIPFFLLYHCCWFFLNKNSRDELESFRYKLLLLPSPSTFLLLSLLLELFVFVVVLVHFVASSYSSC